MAQTDPAYWKTKEGAAFNAISELCNPDASLRERIEAADMLREAFGMPIKHSDDCAIHDSDEPDASDCTCAYWKEPNVEAATAIEQQDQIIAGLVSEATFLLDRLSDLVFCDMDTLVHGFYGHVEPSASRLRALSEAASKARAALSPDAGKTEGETG